MQKEIKRLRDMGMTCIITASLLADLVGQVIALGQVGRSVVIYYVSQEPLADDDPVISQLLQHLVEVRHVRLS